MLKIVPSDRLPLSKKQQRLLDFVVHYSQLGLSPTYDQLAKDYGCVKSNICILLKKLKNKGWVDYTPASSGSLRSL